MKTNHPDQRGFSFLAVLLVLVVIGTLSVVALRVLGSRSDVVDSNTSLSKHTVPAKFTSNSDVAKAAAALDAADVDKGVNPDSLNNDLNAVL